jgi:hypothetical protein
MKITYKIHVNSAKYISKKVDFQTLNKIKIIAPIHRSYVTALQENQYES